MPLLLLLGLAAAAALALSKGSDSPAAGPRVIAAPAGTNINALPPGSIVLIKSFSEALSIMSQGPKGYFGRSIISGTGVTFTPDEITTVQTIAPSALGTFIPAIPGVTVAPTPTVSAGHWY